MGDIPTDKKGFYNYINSLGQFSNAIIVQNREWNQSKFKFYMRYLETRKKDFNLSASEIKSLTSVLGPQIGFFNYLVSNLGDSYNKLKRGDVILRNEKVVVSAFQDLLSYMRGLLALYEEERLALKENDIAGFYDLVKQEHTMYKRTAKFLNSINVSKVAETVKALKPEDKRGSLTLFTSVGLLIFSAVLVGPGCFNDKLHEGFHEIGGGSSLIGSSIWDGVETACTWMWEAINKLGYHTPNWAAGLALLVLVVLGLAAVSRRR